jgi:xylan 1,4-beta-xylosidase
VDVDPDPVTVGSDPDRGVRPVLPGCHPDPSICRVGDDFYLACSSFEYFPGVPLFHSRDLRRWRRIGHALDRPEQLPLTGTAASCGVYAPTLRHHDGRFWLITTIVPEPGTVLVTAEDPTGPWSDPVPLPGVPGIDPDLAWDEEGNCWCTYAGIGQVRIDPRTGATLGEHRRLWSGTPRARWPEAPHLYRIGDTWYLLIAEGGTEAGHAVSIARAPKPDGPFEPCPANPILTHRGLDHPVQHTGHGDLVRAPDDRWWLVFLGVRPRGGSPGWHVLGRETFLAPVSWNADGWPEVGPVDPGPPDGPAPGTVGARFRDDFTSRELDPGWISVRTRSREYVSPADPPGRLILRGRGRGLDDPLVTFLGRRQDAHDLRVRALVDTVHGHGGLAVRMDERHYYAVELGPDEIAVRLRIGPVSRRLGARGRPAGPVLLWIETGGGADPVPHRQAPDLIRLGLLASDGTEVTLAELDGRYLSTEVAGGFTGRVIGGYATTGVMQFHWYDHEPLDRR